MNGLRYVLHVSVVFACEMPWLILAHHTGITGAAKYGGMVAVAWVGAAIGEASLP